MANIQSINNNPIVVGTSGIEDSAVTMAKLASDVQIPQPTDAQVTSAVNTWLTAHPEATTTVQDGSITDAKLVQTGGVLEKVDKLTDALSDNFNIEVDVNPQLVAGSYVFSNDNTIQSSSNFSMTKPIAVKSGQVVRLTATGYNTATGMIATCNADNSERETVARSIDSTEREYTYDVAEDGYIVCSFNNNHAYAISLTIDYYEAVKALAVFDVVQGGTAGVALNRAISGSYVYAQDGSIQSAGTMFISQPISLANGQTLTLNARGYNQAVAMIAEYDSVTGSYTPLVNSVDSTDRTYTYTASESIVVRCSMVFYSSGSNVPYSATITTPRTMSRTLSAMDDRITAVADPMRVIQYPQLFSNIICMGDSLTRGVTEGSSETTRNYPYYFAKLADAEVTNQSQGGITTQSFWNTFASTFDYTSFDCAVIYLGTNGGLTDTVSTDCHADYTQNADTNTGCYGKIIGRIKATAPNCKIFVVAGPNEYIRRATTMNPAVRALAELYGVGLIDVENCILSDAGGGNTAERMIYRPSDGIHYNSFGYMTLANMFYDAMVAFMTANRSVYSD